MYYEENYKKIFSSIENPQWRIFKVISEDGFVRQNKRMINTADKLLAFIKNTKNPKALYMSASTFLNPHKTHGAFYNQKSQSKDHYFYPKAGYLIADEILLNSEFFVDIDSDDLKLAQRDARKIINALKDDDKVSLKLVQFSGTRGIHLIYNHKRKSIANPIERIEYYKREKRRLSNKIAKLKLKTMNETHQAIMENIFAVYAVPYSIKKSGGIVTPINLKEFMKKDIYSFLPNKAIDPSGDDKQVATVEAFSPPQPQKYQGCEGDGLTSCLFFNYVTNRVHGLKGNYITVIKKHLKEFKLNEFRLLQKEYNLSGFAFVNIGDYVFGYNTKLVQFKRLVKIMARVKSENLSTFIKYKRCIIQMSPQLNRDKEKVLMVKEMGILKSHYGRDDPHSKFHSELFGLKNDNCVGERGDLFSMVYQGEVRAFG